MGTEGGRDETPEERADRNFNDILQELRVVLTGTQLISGFLLAVAFQQSFRDLEPHEVVHYLVLVGASAFATLLGLTPVTVHRLHFAKGLKGTIVRVSDRVLVATLAVVSLLVVGVTSFIFEVVVSAEAGLWAAALTGLVVVALWILSVTARHRGVAGEPDRADG
jgi:hypothetical protein